MTLPDLRLAPESLSYLTIETSTWCNLACTGCSRTIALARGGWSNRHMSAAEFSRLIRNLPPSRQATLNGVGEPSLNPDLPAIIRLARADGRLGELFLVCNGQNKDLTVYDRMAEAGLGGVHVSVDSWRPETADQCRKGTRLDLLAASLSRIRELGLGLTVNVVASRFNHLEIPQVLSILNDMGPARVMIQPYLDFGNPAGCLGGDELAALRMAVDAGRSRWRDLDIGLHGLVAGQVEDICSSPWTSLAVTVEGYLTPCCVNFDPAVYGFADLFQVPFAEIWRDPVVQDFLAAYIRQAPTFCRGCHMNGRPTDGDATVVRRAFAAKAGTP